MSDTDNTNNFSDDCKAIRVVETLRLGFHSGTAVVSIADASDVLTPVAKYWHLRTAIWHLRRELQICTEGMSHNDRHQTIADEAIQHHEDTGHDVMCNDDFSKWWCLECRDQGYTT